MRVLSVEKLTWKRGEPKDWPEVFGTNKVPFACMTCGQRTATHRLTLDDRGGVTQIVTCPDCVGLTGEQIADGLHRLRIV